MATEEERLRLLAQARQRQALAQAQLGTVRDGGTGSWAQPEIDLSANRRFQQAPTADDQIAAASRDVLRDNLIGVDDGVTSPGEYIGRMLNTIGESATLGLVGEEATAAARSAITGQGYDAALADERSREAQFREQFPGSALAGDVAGALVPGTGIAGAALRGVSNAGRVARGALGGAAAGGTLGFTEGEGGAQNRAVSGLIGAGAGSFFGAAVPAASGVVSRGLSRLWEQAAERPTVQALREIKNRAYRAVEEAGETFDGDEMTTLRDRISATFADDPTYVPGEDTAVDAVLRMIERRAGQSTTLGQLDNIRQGLWRRVNANPTQVQIYDAISAIDELIDSRAGASALMGQAREANRQFSQSELLQRAFQRAQDQAESTGSGGNLANLYRQAVTRIINNPRQARFFSDDQVAVMREFLTDTGGQRLRRMIGKLSPNGNGLMLALQTFGGVASGGATVPLMAVGEMARRGAQRSVERGADRLLDMTAGISDGRVQPTIGVNALTSGQLAVPLVEENRLQNALRLIQ